MFSGTKESIVVLIVCVILLVSLLSAFIIAIIYKYQQRQIKYFKEMEELKSTYENTLLQSQVEMQEQTFQHIAREIHDNIGQKLTLAKLYLNTISYADIASTTTTINNSLDLISESINGLSDVSRSMSTELVLHNGLVKAIEMEMANVKRQGFTR
jgi:two-component system NarL family sensor kinase